MALRIQKLQVHSDYVSMPYFWLDGSFGSEACVVNLMLYLGACVRRIEVCLDITASLTFFGSLAVSLSAQMCRNQQRCVCVCVCVRVRVYARTL